jgi:hypothetical protein
MKFTYTKSQFEMPDGKYLAKFLGCTLRELQPGETPKLGQDGKPLPPAMTWDFEIIEGPADKPDPANVGKKADKLTGRMPTPKSGCGKMLAAIADAVLKDGVEVDIANYVGKVYRVTVIENRVSENPGPSRIHDYQSPSSASFGTPSRRWDVSDGQNVMSAQSDADVCRLIEAGADPTALKLKPAGAPREQAKTAAEWGFKAAPEPAGLKPDGTPANASDPIPW